MRLWRLRPQRHCGGSSIPQPERADDLTWSSGGGWRISWRGCCPASAGAAPGAVAGRFAAVHGRLRRSWLRRQGRADAVAASATLPRCARPVAGAAPTRPCRSCAAKGLARLDGANTLDESPPISPGWARIAGVDPEPPARPRPLNTERPRTGPAGSRNPTPQLITALASERQCRPGRLKETSACCFGSDFPYRRIVSAAALGFTRDRGCLRLELRRSCVFIFQSCCSFVAMIARCRARGARRM